MKALTKTQTGLFTFTELSAYTCDALATSQLCECMLRWEVRLWLLNFDFYSEILFHQITDLYIPNYSCIVISCIGDGPGARRGTLLPVLMLLHRNVVFTIKMCLDKLLCLPVLEAFPCLCHALLIILTLHPSLFFDVKQIMIHTSWIVSRLLEYQHYFL